MDMESRQLTVDHEKGTSHGVYSLLREMSNDVQEVKDGLYDNRHEAEGHFHRIDDELSLERKEITDLKISAGVTEHRMTELREDVKELRQEVNGLRGDLREIAGSLGAMQTRFNWWLVIVGIAIAALQYWKG